MRLKNKIQLKKGIGLCLIPFFISSCSLFASRPTQEMSDTLAAIQAAYEVQADSLAPEYLRQAKEWYFRARGEYKMKNFAEARESARKARIYAEKAEFLALRTGGKRGEAPVDPSSPLSAPPPPPMPTPALLPLQEPSPEPGPPPGMNGVLHRPDESPTPESTPTPTPTPPVLETPPPPMTR